MAEQKLGNLTYSLAEAETAIADNINRLGSDDPNDRAIARLNRDLVAVLDGWLAKEQGSLDVVAVLDGAMHGTLTISGTILSNLPQPARAEAFEMMRTNLIEMFDAMGEAVNQDPEVTP